MLFILWFRYKGTDDVDHVFRKSPSDVLKGCKGMKEVSGYMGLLSRSVGRHLSHTFVGSLEI